MGVTALSLGSNVCEEEVEAGMYELPDSATEDDATSPVQMIAAVAIMAMLRRIVRIQGPYWSSNLLPSRRIIFPKRHWYTPRE